MLDSITIRGSTNWFKKIKKRRMVCIFKSYWTCGSLMLSDKKPNADKEIYKTKDRSKLKIIY